MYGIEINRQSEISIIRQIYQKLREQILNGGIAEGEALPSTRYLAKLLGVSRSTICEAYDMLLAEGFIINHQGSPFRVSEGVIMGKPFFEMSNKEKFIGVQHINADFRTGQPDLRCFPRNLWNRLLRKSYEEMSLNQFGYTGPDGLTMLREEIAKWLFRSKGIKVDFENIFITSGATQALHILAGLLSKEGKEILIEDPCHKGMYEALKSRGFPMCPIPVDEQGIQTKYLDGRKACAIYLTPSHQFPMGGILPANRRAALIRFARENEIFIIEDDYDSEFRYCGEPIAPLFSMDQLQVIYVGTFSKILFPALRIGYVVLPGQLHKKWRYLRTHMDVQNPPFEQAALAELLRSRKLDGHVKRMRNLYGIRRKVLIESLKEKFGNCWRLFGDSAGLHIAIEFKGLAFDNDFTIKSREQGILVTPMELHSIIKGVHIDKLLLGYGHLEPDEIHKGVGLLYKFMKKIGYLNIE